MKITLQYFSDLMFSLPGLNNLLAAYSDKTAFAQCTFAFCEGKGHPVKLFKGITNVRDL